MSEVTRVLALIDEGQTAAAADLLPLVYEDLRKLAAEQLREERPGLTLQATALVHEAYLRLMGGTAGEPSRWNSRGHFFRAAAEAMRRILIENARRRHALKHGGDRTRVPLEQNEPSAPGPDGELLALHEALQEFASVDPQKAQLVELRYFAGLTMSDAARILDISLATAERQWAYSKAWLFRRMHNGT